MSESQICVRYAIAADAAAIAVLYKQLIGNRAVNVLPENIARLGGDSSSALFVCEVDGRVCGTALVALCDDAMFGVQPFAVVENVIVEAAMQSQGLGAALMREVERFCAEHDCSKIMLLSSAGREDAHRFFARCGFSGTVKRGFVKYRSEFGV